MSEFTQLVSSEPIVTPAIPEKIYDKLWVDMLTLTSPEVNKITLYCKLIPCRDIENGEKELKQILVEGDVKVIQIENLWTESINVPELAIAMESVFKAIVAYRNQGNTVISEE